MTLRMGEHELELGGPYLGDLREATAMKDDPEALRRRLEEDGYLLIRGLHDPAQVLAARQLVLENLDANGQIDRSYPLEEGWIATDARGQFLGGAKAISHTSEFLAVVEAPELMDWFSALFGAPAMTFDYKWIRAVGQGANTGAHYDIVYMGRGTRDLYTCWTPLGQVSYDLGPLAVWSGSHLLDKVRETYGNMDVDRDRVEGWFSRNPIELVDRYGGQWLTAEFEPGDTMVFGMFTMHGSLTNVSGRYRLSTDTRYQRADEPADPRWVGHRPTAHAESRGRARRPMAEVRQRWDV